MPVHRGWFDLLVDDDGSGTTGTVWNKAQVGHLYDDIDAWVWSRAAWAASVTTAEGAAVTVANPVAHYSVVGDQLFFRLHLGSAAVPGATAYLKVGLPIPPILDNVDEILMRLYTGATELGYGVARTGNFLEVYRFAGPWAAGSHFLIGSGFYFIR